MLAYLIVFVYDHIQPLRHERFTHLVEGWMSNSKRTKAKFIDDVQVTKDCLTSRAGLNLFARYLRGIGLFISFRTMKQDQQILP